MAGLASWLHRKTRDDREVEDALECFVEALSLDLSGAKPISRSAGGKWPISSTTSMQVDTIDQNCRRAGSYAAELVRARLVISGTPISPFPLLIVVFPSL
jgi:hypothetical protein